MHLLVYLIKMFISSLISMQVPVFFNISLWYSPETYSGTKLQDTQKLVKVPFMGVAYKTDAA